jgi:hypothetical protein
MEILSSTAIGLVGMAAGYGVLVAADYAKGFLQPLGRILGAFILIGSLFTVVVCLSKCASVYQKQCPMSSGWKEKSVNTSVPLPAAATAVS